MKRLTPFIQYIKTSLRASLMRTLIFLYVAVSSIADIQALTFTGYSSKSIISAIYANHESKSNDLTNLINPTITSGYCTGSVPSSPAYLEIDIKNGGLSQNEEGCLVVYTRRVHTLVFSANSIDNPTAFRVDGQFEGSNEWKQLFNVYFIYRGSQTDEYSSRIPLRDIWTKIGNSNGTLKKMRFYIVATNGNVASDTKNIAMALNRFDVIKIGQNEEYSEMWSDRFHLTSDYLSDVKNYEFVNTRGVFDESNRPEGWEEITQVDKNVLKSKGINIDFPDYTLLESNTSAYPLASGQKRQPVHTVEHILYAMPGDVIPLYPYYDLPNPQIIEFQENFSHWYDYENGGRLKYPSSSSANQWAKDFDMLDFLTNPAKIQVSDTYGFFGGSGMNSSGKEYVISSVQDYIDAVTEINEKNYSDACIELAADLNFGGRTDIPMLGDKYAFSGIFNGNGHRISNLLYNYPTYEGVGFIRKTTNLALIENIILDKTCTFIGSNQVGGIVGIHESGTLTIKNIHTEAWVYGVRQGGEQNAAGVLGYSWSKELTSIKVEDCYIGGKIGNPDTNISNSFNAALLAGWWVATDISSFKNIVVNCDLTGWENAGYRNKIYIRHNENNASLVKDAQGVISKGHLRFKNCFGNLEPDDKCWTTMDEKIALPSDVLTILKNSEWDTETMTPKMENTDLSSGYSYKYSINSVSEYIQTVKKINQNQEGNVYIELLKDLDFSTAAESVPIIYEGMTYNNKKIFVNGRGHTISNLHINRTINTSTYQNVGLIGWSGETRIENLILDKTCIIEATTNGWNGYVYVGIVGRYYGGKFTAKNIKSEATIINNGSFGYTGGILGFCSYEQNNNYLEMENIYIGGNIGKTNCCALVGCISTGDCKNNITTSKFKNIIVDCLISKLRGNQISYIGQGSNTDFVSNTEDPSDNKHFTKTLKNQHGITFTNDYQNCYGNLDSSDVCWIKMTSKLIIPLISGWKNEITPSICEIGAEKLRGNGDRLPGTMATFFCPRNPFDDSINQELPLNGKKEFIIAADFSQRFDPLNNLDHDERKVYEPTIAFRHIFRIRDGKQFADEISGSVENNENYIRRTQKLVSARSGVQFQIRLEQPAPVVGGTSYPQSNYYYKVSDTEYRRVYGMDIKVFDGDTRNELSGSQGFYTGSEFYGRGMRDIDGEKYDFLDGCNIVNPRFYRMLQHDSPKQGHYIVQIIGLDRNDNRIKIMGTDQDLVIMEYNIIFLPPMGGTMLREDELYSEDDRYETVRVEYLNEVYGGDNKQPITYIDFDEYIKINKMQGNDVLKNKLIAYINYDNGKYTPSAPTPNGKESSYFKWPVPWDQSNYSFGYNRRQDYNMYMLATHSDCVPFMLQAKKWTKNMPGDYDGLYDRSYYDSMRRYKNENKTRAASSEEVEQGYFYYVNAATDPGVSARLTINEICQGSTIHVSAWMAEFSNNTEKANLSFNFVAVLGEDYETSHPNSGLRGGDRVVLHSFITGEVKKTGEWLNVYYSFVPRLAEFSNEGITSEDVDHYEIELDNNAKSSKGADYAIDDIRVYVEPPMVEVAQLKPACDNASTRLKMISPFETLLEIVGQPEAISSEEGESLAAYYTIINKPNFDIFYKQFQDQGELEPGKKAYEKSVVQFNYNRGSDTDEHNYGKVTFNSNYSKNKDYKFDPDFTLAGEAYKSTDTESGERFIVFESDVAPGKFDVGAEYYVVLKAAFSDIAVGGDDPENDAWTFFDMMGDCANKNVVIIKPSQIIKIDGEIKQVLDNIKVCENQSPVIQVNVLGTDDTTGEMVEVQKNSYFDWFNGPLTDKTSGKGFRDIHELGNPDHTLEKALWAFRSRYPYAEDLYGIKPDGDDYSGSNDNKLEEWMLKLLDEAISSSVDSPTPLLTLYKTSYVMPPLQKKEGMTVNEGHVVVIPISNIEEQENYIICTSPVQLNIKMGNQSPILKHGLTDIGYPEDLADVPLRIGIDQLKTNLTELSGQESRKLDIPVRLASSSDGSASRKLNLVTESVHTFDQYKRYNEVVKEGAVILVQTNDPEYKDLGTLDENNEETKTLLWVGDIKTLNAVTNKENATQYFQVEFDRSFNFKEGYFYRFRFQFEEEGTADDDNVCAGQDVFTLKIVPRFLAWTGENSLNWNDDGNWRRVSGYYSQADTPKNDLELSNFNRSVQFAHYITNGLKIGVGVIANSNTNAYAPLDFTNVIVEEGMESPFMYHPAEERAEKVKDEYDGTRKYVWPSNPEKGASTLQEDDPGAEVVGKVTPLIHYDMAAFEFGDSKGRNDAEVGCRPWYANTCNEIHFKPGGTIMNQQELIYKKAWVDVELDHSRWQTVSTPLQEVYAGDFYLPSDGARQATELYQDINFDNDRKINDRFKPAVFQRGWDKSEAKVYEIDGPEVDATDVRNVAVKTFWSHVYNDVKEEYGGGVGFSIKTDISAMTTKNKPVDGGKVLFRLPKADTEYLYWNKDGSKSGHETTITRGEGQHRLNESHGTITAQAAENGLYFLVGNPFMTHMDIKEFLKVNKDKLEQKYWIVTKTGQIAGSVDASGEFVAADPTDAEWAEDPTVISPMQGFFVKSKTSATSMSLSYDETMMRRYDSSGNYLTSTTRSEETLSALKISSYNYGEPSSAALLLTSGNADADNDVEAMDNRDLDILSTVYTAKEGKALSINFCGEAEGTEIGVIADEGIETVIRFEGVEAAEGLYLLDKAEHSLTPLEEGMEVTVEGAAVGRFFLTYGIADEGMLSGIEWSVNGGVLTVVDNAASGSLEVNVYDTVGRIVKRDATNEDVLEMLLEHGIYVVELRTSKEHKSIKIRI